MKSLQAKQAITAWKMLSISLILLMLVAAYPLAKTFYFSFTNARLDDLEGATFNGIENYKTLFNDELWWQSVGTTLKFTGISVSIELVLGLAIALALSKDFPFRSFVRAMILIPWAIPTVVSTRIWEWMYNEQYGFINHILLKLHVVDSAMAFLAEPSMQMYSVVLIDVWKTTPFMVLLLLAGLTTISTEVHEAAKVDGATPWQSFWKVTLPLLKPTILVALTFRVLDSLRVFDVFYVLFSNNEKTSTMSIYARTQLIDFQEMGIGSAASVMIFLIIGIFILMQTLFLRKET
ncbi:MAG: sugar ABC transporter permease [Bdellovibrionota bacterium]